MDFLKKELDYGYLENGWIIMEKRTLAEEIEKLLEGKTTLIDNSICGRCSKCGECCTNLLPVCKDEINQIQAYVLKNNIKPQLHMLVMTNMLTCPYFDGKKCLIYEVRPLICKEFYCFKRPSIELAKKFSEKNYFPVDMWQIANQIEKNKFKS